MTKMFGILNFGHCDLLFNLYNFAVGNISALID
jgi:hypothetical protein